jgi:ribosome-binding protein aMBF1 (putative translation factor)
MNDEIRKAVRVELAKRDWNKTTLAQEVGSSKQHVGELLSGKSGNVSEVWGRIFKRLGFKLVVVKDDGA